MNLALDKWEHQTDKVLLVPYRADQTGIFRETFMAQMYMRLKEDGLVDKVYPGCEQMDLNRFIAYMKDKPTVIYLMKPEKVMGFGWIIEAEGKVPHRRGSFGFTFFKNDKSISRKEDYVLRRDMIWLCLDWWINSLGIESLYGVTLRSNALARNFSRIFGFRDLGVLPKFFTVNGQLDDGQLVFLDRETFKPLYDYWRYSRESLETHALTVQ